MRIITWNMGCGPRASQYRKHHDDAWTYLLDDLRPDVALVQEALLARIDVAREGHAITLCDLAPEVRAGTAVLVRSFETNPVESIVVGPETYTAACEVQTATGPLRVASVHVYPGDKQYADLRRLSELLGPISAERPILVGGDFNAARRFDEVHGGKKYRASFEAMDAAGLHEVHWRLHGREVQSFWGRQTKEAYQDDHFFISKSWASRVRSCEVIDNDLVRRVSDHGPVVMELDVSAARDARSGSSDAWSCTVGSRSSKPLAPG